MEDGWKQHLRGFWFLVWCIILRTQVELLAVPAKQHIAETRERGPGVTGERAEEEEEEEEEDDDEEAERGGGECTGKDGHGSCFVQAVIVDG